MTITEPRSFTMGDCCTDTACEIEKLRATQMSTLRAVLLVNACMFGIEFAAGLLAGSTALLADSLDMLGDALVYGFSLYVVTRDDGWKARSAYLKSGVMIFFGCFVLAEALHRSLNPELPELGIMTSIGFAALVANGLCLGLLWRHRAEDVNMRSVWLCSRNDIIANSAVLGAAGAVWVVNSPWPDLLVGVGIAILFLRSGLAVFRDATATLAAHRRTIAAVRIEPNDYDASARR